MPSQKGAPDPPELQLQVVVRHDVGDVGAGNPAQVLCRYYENSDHWAVSLALDVVLRALHWHLILRTSF